MKTYKDGIIIHKNGILFDSGGAELGNIKVADSYLESTNLPVKNDWDRAHLLYQENKNHADVDFLEPDKQNFFEGPFPNLFYDEAIARGLESSGRPDDYCKAVISYDGVWTRPANDVKQIWHLTDQFSQLKAARQSVTATLKNRAEETIIRVAHLDTGYDPEHITFPENIIRKDLERNFTGHGNQDNAVDTGDGLNGVMAVVL
jgi:hypothetical protein